MARCKSPLGTKPCLEAAPRAPPRPLHILLPVPGRLFKQLPGQSTFYRSPNPPQTFQEPSVLSQRPVSFIAPTTFFRNLSVYCQPYTLSRSPVVRGEDFVPPGDV